MLARIAQELFWLGRDLTRAEHTARMLDGAFHADVADAPGQRGIALSWGGVMAIIGAKSPAPGEQPPGATPVPFDRGEVARLLTLDTDSPASIVSCVSRARERARTLRDVISTEMWESLNSFYLSLGRYDLQAALVTGPYSLYQEVKERCALFWGIVERTMLRDEGRSFLEAGGRIEDADMMLRMLRVAVPAVSPASGESLSGPDHDHEGEALAVLQSIGGLQAYRRAVRHPPTLAHVARFLLYDGSYPGSVASAVEALSQALGTADAQPRSSPPVLRLGRLIADLELQRRTAERVPLHETLERVQDELELVDQDIGDRYFAIAALAAVHL
jgi:uncharacterized alpha-E superfamily protein